ncbi:MAG: SDR family oxidoreductase [Candidatus Omnitrophica bacterium]|nr:SDR family oxidoreductase [Candidatus Omnitrophota bacterium]
MSLRHRILIAGVGFLGRPLATALAEQGHEVWGLSRSGQSLPGGVRPVIADLTDARSLRDLPAPLDYAVFCAAPDEPDEAAYRALYLDGTRNLVRALREQTPGLRRFFCVSSTGVYGQANGEWVNEDSVTEPRRYQGRIALEAEGVARGLGSKTTILRCGGIYGPGRSRLIRRAWAGELSYLRSPEVYTNRIHYEDASRIVAHLMGLEAPADLYLAVDKHPASRSEVFCWLAGQLGAPAPKIVEAENRDCCGFDTNKRCSNERLLSTGYKFKYSTYREGYKELIGCQAP